MEKESLTPPPSEPVILPPDEVCACLNDTGSRRVTPYIQCHRCKAFMDGDYLVLDRDLALERAERAETALSFYANIDNWTQPASWGGRLHDDESRAIRDYGKVARAALGEAEDGE